MPSPTTSVPTRRSTRRTRRATRPVAASALATLMALTVLGAGHPAVAAAETDLPPTGQTFEHYPAMKDVYQDYFSFGIFGAGEIDGLIYNYASYTPGNEMKPESTQAVKGVFTFDAADAAMARYAVRNPDLTFSGHTLAWHSQTPTWMWDAPPARYDQPGTFDRDVALANLNNHIDNVLGRFGSELVAFDVVNEAVGTANPADWRASLAKGEGWYQALGSDWVELAFLRSAQVVDANGWDVKLVYNDFGLDSPAKARVVYEMVKDINERNAGVRPDGKPLIEVIGMQGHYNLDTDVAAVESNIKLFGSLGNVEVNVTEMDIALPPGTLTPENENNQGMKYAELFQVYRDHAAGPANTTSNPHVITAVKLAGVRDVLTGWKGGEFAMPYDYDGKAKDALLGILYPAEFLATHDYIEIPGGGEHPPVPGVHVFDTSEGDSWSGANIVLGDDASVWPWSTTDDGEAAFRPEQGATYRFTVNYTAKGTTAIRVRWLRDNTNGGYTSGDGALVNSHPYRADQVATFVPAYFNSGMVNMGSYDLVTEITLDGTQPADGLVGNLGIRGGGGGNAFSINTITVEKVSPDGDQLLVNWPQGIPAAPSTTLTYQGNNWITVSLAAEATAPATLARTEYRVDGGDWVTYTEPFTLKRSDRQTLAYRSVDSFGTAEEERCVVLDPGDGTVDVEIAPDAENVCA
ncbi:endo-1,4-beta-xylanase [Antribacter gilvus]|uniref:endo-1,4-beta-xylanase n=1 Tax=Antribacter gilvus TaxID=2304675 RepID=UPI0013DE82DD|nr:endo-1,4-beta-xylanase [Antribacter gilvus]